MIKLMVINIAFRKPLIYKRWRLLAKEYEDIDVTLIGPSYSDTKQFGQPIIYRPKNIKEKRFQVLHIRMEEPKWFKGTGWISWELFKLVGKIKPDFLYLIGHEDHNITYEIEIIRKLLLPKMKIVGFSMRGLDYNLNFKNPLKSLFRRSRISSSSKIFDAMMCHYPHGRKVITEQRRYDKPVYMQTQIGVDNDVYHPNEAMRKSVREKYRIKDQFVFGSASRIDSIKGVFDILKAIEEIPEKNKWKLIMLGDGKDMEVLKEKIRSSKLEDNVILPGYVQQGKELASYFNAMDCFIHVPQTTQYWVDTFPVAVVEAMATAIPIIGSDSGAVPYQLGSKGVIIRESNIESLKNSMIHLMKNPKISKDIGNELNKRVMNTFEIRHLNKCFNIIMREILNNEFDKKHVDQTSFKFD
jgi:glycosyltransferase involved in cell wall biosynthesis